MEWKLSNIYNQWTKRRESLPINKLRSIRAQNVITDVDKGNDSILCDRGNNLIKLKIMALKLKVVKITT